MDMRGGLPMVMEKDAGVADRLMVVKGPNMARGGVNSLFKNSTNSLEQEVSK